MTNMARLRAPLIQIKDISATSLMKVPWLLSYGGTKEPSGLDRTVPFPAPVLAAFCCADGLCWWPNLASPCKLGQRASQTRFSQQIDRKWRSQLTERRGMAFSGPVAAGDLRRFDDAAVARRQAAPIRSFAISASKFRRPPQRRHGPCKPGKDILDSRAHGCSPS